MTRQKKTIENMFVPQTFNGERMVSVGASDRSKSSNGASPTPTFDINNITSNPTPTRTNKAPTSNIPAETNKKQSKNPDSIVQNGIVQPFQLTLFSREQQEQPEQPKYWSEANIVILIQLHKRYISEKNNQQELSMDEWKRLTEEFNKITSNNRSVDSVTKRWTKILKKYNAERQWVILEQQRSKSNQIISCWTHYQFLNSYLSHLPITSSPSLNEKETRKRNTRQYENDVWDSDDSDYERSNRKRRSEFVTPTLSLDFKLQSLFETQRTMVEQAMTRQQSQIDMMKENYESLNKMNMKFIKVCERITARSETNEKRYLDLLERYVNEKIDAKNQNSLINNNNNANNNASLDNENDEFLSPVTAETWLGVED